MEKFFYVFEYYTQLMILNLTETILAVKIPRLDKNLIFRRFIPEWPDKWFMA